MPKAEIEHAPTRRKFPGHLAGGAAVLAVAGTANHNALSDVPEVGGPMVAPPHAVKGVLKMLDGTINLPASGPDTKLIALCAQFDGYAREIHQAVDGDENGDPPLSQTHLFTTISIQSAS
jgi:hypothetical protein